jgi:hypothetical protein
MAEFAKPRVIGFRSAISTRRWRTTAVSSGSNCAARAIPWPSSTWVISLLPCRKAADSPQTTVATSVSSSTTRKRPARHSMRLELPYLRGRSLIFGTPWGNRIETVGYDNIQFTKAPNVLRGMGLMHLAKNEKAKKELAEKGMALE